MNYFNIGNKRVDIYKNIAESNKFVLFKLSNKETFHIPAPITRYSHTELLVKLFFTWPSIVASASIPPTPHPATPNPSIIVVCESVPTTLSG